MHTIEVNGKYLQSIEDLKAIIGKTVLFRYPKNPQGHRFFQTGRVIQDEGAVNPLRIEYADCDSSIQSEGIFAGQIENGNVEVIYTYAKSVR